MRRWASPSGRRCHAQVLERRIAPERRCAEMRGRWLELDLHGRVVGIDVAKPGHWSAVWANVLSDRADRTEQRSVGRKNFALPPFRRERERIELTTRAATGKDCGREEVRALPGLKREAWGTQACCGFDVTAFRFMSVFGDGNPAAPFYHLGRINLVVFPIDDCAAESANCVR